jgi:glucosamine-6-phosphate deaminase
MRKNFFSKIDIDLNNTNLPNGLAEDLAAECKRYDALIDSLGGVDIQVLGIGNNGHIGFNEPDTFFPKGTSVIELTDSTIEANSRFFASRDLVPTRALSMGIGHIMSAKNIVMIALGSGKADILEAALFGKVTPEVPASILQFYQGNITVVADEAAMATIKARHPEIA